MNATKRIYRVQEPKYAADVPEFLLTPDKVETDLLGDLEFFDGMPTNRRFRKPMTFSTCREACRRF
jgi:cephalosporin-C deacetylase-like acetyl esterase